MVQSPWFASEGSPPGRNTVRFLLETLQVSVRSKYNSSYHELILYRLSPLGHWNKPAGLIRKHDSGSPYLVGAGAFMIGSKDACPERTPT